MGQRERRSAWHAQHLPPPPPGEGQLLQEVKRYEVSGGKRMDAHIDTRDILHANLSFSCECFKVTTSGERSLSIFCQSGMVLVSRAFPHF